MQTLEQQMSFYAAYHQDARNKATHFVGVPMIVFAVGVLLAKPAFMLAGWALTPAWIVFAAVAVWYLTRGNLQLGLAVSAAVGVLIALAHRVGDSATGAWLAWGIGFFVVGWAIQFIGHWYEGRKPAFVDDLIGLLVGPMFVTASVLLPMKIREGQKPSSGVIPRRIRTRLFLEPLEGSSRF